MKQTYIRDRPQTREMFNVFNTDIMVAPPESIKHFAIYPKSHQGNPTETIDMIASAVLTLTESDSRDMSFVEVEAELHRGASTISNRQNALQVITLPAPKVVFSDPFQEGVRKIWFTSAAFSKDLIESMPPLAQPAVIFTFTNAGPWHPLIDISVAGRWSFDTSVHYIPGRRPHTNLADTWRPNQAAGHDFSFVLRLPLQELERRELDEFRDLLSEPNSEPDVQPLEDSSDTSGKGDREVPAIGSPHSRHTTPDHISRSRTVESILGTNRVPFEFVESLPDGQTRVVAPDHTSRMHEVPDLGQPSAHGVPTTSTAEQANREDPGASTSSEQPTSSNRDTSVGRQGPTVEDHQQYIPPETFPPSRATTSQENVEWTRHPTGHDDLDSFQRFDDSLKEDRNTGIEAVVHQPRLTPSLSSNFRNRQWLPVDQPRSSSPIQEEQEEPLRQMDSETSRKGKYIPERLGLSPSPPPDENRQYPGVEHRVNPARHPDVSNLAGPSQEQGGRDTSLSRPDGIMWKTWTPPLLDSSEIMQLPPHNELSSSTPSRSSSPSPSLESDASIKAPVVDSSSSPEAIAGEIAWTKAREVAEGSKQEDLRQSVRSIKKATRYPRNIPLRPPPPLADPETTDDSWMPSYEFKDGTWHSTFRKVD